MEWKPTLEGTVPNQALSDSQIPDNTSAIAAHAATMDALDKLAEARTKFHEAVGQADALIGLLTAVTNAVSTLAPMFAPHVPAVAAGGNQRIVDLIGGALGTTDPATFIRDELSRLLAKT